MMDIVLALLWCIPAFVTFRNLNKTRRVRDQAVKSLEQTIEALKGEQP